MPNLKCIEPLSMISVRSLFGKILNIIIAIGQGSIFIAEPAEILNGIFESVAYIFMR